MGACSQIAECSLSAAKIMDSFQKIGMMIQLMAFIVILYKSIMDRCLCSLIALCGEWGEEGISGDYAEE